MAKLNAQEFMEKWSRKTKAATSDYQRGVERVSEAPGMAAARRAQAYEEGVRRAVADGKWQRRTESVSLEEWKRKAVAKGVGRIAAGVDEATPKVAAFASELLPYQDSLKGQLGERGDLEQNIARSAEWQRGMARFRRG